ncbi:Membrane protein insertase YidC [Buchnera aphidicola (Cinara kochiana kochiana)]|uniref:Membrane protein insertase YidC n=1 Tax=Buchnera aphidicola (Cinara kochiana kochiana) TaxID=2518976 RepID=A0A451D595_9GAMM|nr:membrane protein insertase YidC [Buchnera aphidicola]VFP80935.1 Membrane protein insertase YidC [Buchnera aphidicola (Cinara kochiana kochiana)]
MIYFKRIFFIISCVLFSFLIWNFWNTHFSINQNNLKVNNFIHNISNINDNYNNQFTDTQNNFLSLNIKLLNRNNKYINILQYYRYVKISSLLTILQNKKKTTYNFINKIINNQYHDIQNIKKFIYFSKLKLYKKLLNFKIINVFTKKKLNSNIFYLKIISIIKNLYHFNIYDCIKNQINYIIYNYVHYNIFNILISVKKNNFFLIYHKNYQKFSFNNFFKTYFNKRIGSVIQNKILKIFKNLKINVKRSWLYIFIYPLFYLLNFFYKLLNNWGVSIILVTILLKIVTYPITKLQYVSILKIKLLKPEIKQIKHQLHDDVNTINKKIFLLYQSKQINPLINLLSAILQAPIFLAFYYVLASSIELHHAPFIFWIRDLSSYDPYYILPMCISISVLFTQFNELNFKNIFKQKNFLCILPVLYTGFFIWLPSGLALYYLTSNIFTYLQQWIIRRNFVKNK